MAKQKSALDDFLGSKKPTYEVEGVDDADFEIDDFEEEDDLEFGDDSLEEGSEDDDSDVDENASDDEDEAGDDDEEEQEDPKEDSSDGDEAEETEAEEPDEAKDKIANLEKRLKDNRSSYLKEHELRLTLEKENEELRKGKPAKESDSLFDDDEGDEEIKPKEVNPEIKVLRAELDQLKADREQQEREANVKEFKSKEDSFKSDHDDYDDMREMLETVYSTNNKVRERFNEMGATPEAVYKLGREIQAQLDPEGYEDYLKAKVKKKRTEKNRIKKEKLKALEGNSQKPGNVAKSNKRGSVCDELFGRK